MLKQEGFTPTHSGTTESDVYKELLKEFSGLKVKVFYVTRERKTYLLSIINNNGIKRSQQEFNHVADSVRKAQRGNTYIAFGGINNAYVVVESAPELSKENQAL